MSLDLRRVGHEGGGEKKSILGVLRTKFRIKELNPRLVYFHYLQN